MGHLLQQQVCQKPPTKVHSLKSKLLIRDLRLLLDLLATSSGIAPAIAIMTLFDRVGGTLLLN